MSYLAPDTANFRVAVEAACRVAGESKRKRRKKVAAAQRLPFAVIAQHDFVGRSYHIDALFNKPGRYTILLSGGRPDPVKHQWCKPPLAGAEVELWSSKRRIVNYSLEVTNTGVEPVFSQLPVDTYVSRLL